MRSEEHTTELQSRQQLVCRLQLRLLRPRVTAVVLALSSLTLTAAGEPAVRTGASLTELTVMLSVSVSVSTPPLAVLPLSWTVHLRLLLSFPTRRSSDLSP